MIYLVSALVVFMVIIFTFTTIMDRRNFKELLKSFDIEKYYGKEKNRNL